MVELQLQIAKKSQSSSEKEPTLKEAFITDEKYKRASWVNFGEVIFHELTAINVILSYSNTILQNILGDPSEQTSGFTARQGTYVIAVSNFLASVLCIWTIRTFGRRPLLIFGHCGISLAYLLMGIFTIIGFNYGLLTMICVFLLIYQNTSGPIAWTYATETCCDISLGANILVLYLSILVLQMTTQPLMNSALHPAGVFFLFSVCSFFAIFYMYFMIPETMGLSCA